MKTLLLILVFGSLLAGCSKPTDPFFLTRTKIKTERSIETARVAEQDLARSRIRNAEIEHYISEMRSSALNAERIAQESRSWR